ncbi:MAG: hypothetical protein ABIC95_02715 [archaeon]
MTLMIFIAMAFSATGQTPTGHYVQYTMTDGTAVSETWAWQKSDNNWHRTGIEQVKDGKTTTLDNDKYPNDKVKTAAEFGPWIDQWYSKNKDVKLFVTGVGAFTSKEKFKAAADAISQGNTPASPDVPMNTGTNRPASPSYTVVGNWPSKGFSGVSGGWSSTPQNTLQDMVTIYFPDEGVYRNYPTSVYKNLMGISEQGFDALASTASELNIYDTRTNKELSYRKQADGSWSLFSVTRDSVTNKETTEELLTTVPLTSGRAVNRYTDAGANLNPTPAPNVVDPLTINQQLQQQPITYLDKAAIETELKAYYDQLPAGHKWGTYEEVKQSVSLVMTSLGLPSDRKSREALYEQQYGTKPGTTKAENFAMNEKLLADLLAGNIDIPEDHDSRKDVKNLQKKTAPPSQSRQAPVNSQQQSVVQKPTNVLDVPAIDAELKSFFDNADKSTWNAESKTFEGFKKSISNVMWALGMETGAEDQKKLYEAVFGQPPTGDAGVWRTKLLKEVLNGNANIPQTKANRKDFSKFVAGSPGQAALQGVDIPEKGLYFFDGTKHVKIDVDAADELAVQQLLAEYNLEQIDQTGYNPQTKTFYLNFKGNSNGNSPFVTLDITNRVETGYQDEFDGKLSYTAFIAPDLDRVEMHFDDKGELVDTIKIGQRGTKGTSYRPNDFTFIQPDGKAKADDAELRELLKALGSGYSPSVAAQQLRGREFVKGNDYTSGIKYKYGDTTLTLTSEKEFVTITRREKGKSFDSETVKIYTEKTKLGDIVFPAGTQGILRRDKNGDVDEILFINEKGDLIGMHDEDSGKYCELSACGDSSGGCCGALKDKVEFLQTGRATWVKNIINFFGFADNLRRSAAIGQFLWGFAYGDKESEYWGADWSDFFEENRRGSIHQATEECRSVIYESYESAGNFNGGSSDSIVGGNRRYVDAGGQLIEGASINGFKVVITYWNETSGKQDYEYMYRFTFMVSAINEPVDFKIEFLHDQTYTNVFTDTFVLRDGESISRRGDSSVTIRSSKEYNAVCIHFTAGGSGIMDLFGQNGDDLDKRLCAPLIDQIQGEEAIDLDKSSARGYGWVFKHAFDEKAVDNPDEEDTNNDLGINPTI